MATEYTSVNHIVTKDVYAEMQEMNLPQWEDSTNINKLLAIIATKKQEQFDLFISIAEGFLIDNAVGSQLDCFGELLGVSRTTSNDDDYRIILKLRGFRSRTSGTHSDILSLISRYTGQSETTIDIYKGLYKNIDVSFIIGCLKNPTNAVSELVKMFPALTSYRLVAKAEEDQPFYLKSYYDDDDTTSGLVSYTDTSVSGQTGAYLGSLIATSD